MIQKHITNMNNAITCISKLLGTRFETILAHRNVKVHLFHSMGTSVRVRRHDFCQGRGYRYAELLCITITPIKPFWSLLMESQI